MGILALTTSFPWNRYSKKLIAKIDKPYCIGSFTPQESEARDMHFAAATAGKIEDGNLLTLYWLVDREDGVIVDAKFQLFGQSALIGAADAACELLIGKNYDQAKRISAELIDKQLRDKPEEPAFPNETVPHLHLVLEAIESASAQCINIPFAETYTTAPVPFDIGETLEGGYPGWLDLTLTKKIAIIEEVLDQDVRPYIALDAGGVKVLNLLHDTELLIAYEGSCTSCYSSIGSTLSYIQQVLRAKVHPTLIVTPMLESS